MSTYTSIVNKKLTTPAKCSNTSFSSFVLTLCTLKYIQCIYLIAIQRNKKTIDHSLLDM